MILYCGYCNILASRHAINGYPDISSNLICYILWPRVAISQHHGITISRVTILYHERVAIRNITCSDHAFCDNRILAFVIANGMHTRFFEIPARWMGSWKVSEHQGIELGNNILAIPQIRERRTMIFAIWKHSSRIAISGTRHNGYIDILRTDILFPE